ncbi:MAG: hypothetical protein RMH75_03350 [Archaeoglobaceae archaeon]|nr:hypothetical protein [Archaeoglobaceae archaeon]MDW7989692.1 hypothetical protein [Archaeoglobaceae archaeon]
MDPKGEKVLDGKKARCYVIGGIVDKSENRDLTSIIAHELLKSGIKCDRRRIELRGDTIGVPDRINHIEDIVLRVVVDGVKVEEAVREVQPKIVARWRLRRDLPKKGIRLRIGNKTIRVVPKSCFSEFDWLNLKKIDFYKVCREQKLYLVSDRVIEEIKKLRLD